MENEIKKTQRKKLEIIPFENWLSSNPFHRVAEKIKSFTPIFESTNLSKIQEDAYSKEMEDLLYYSLPTDVIKTIKHSKLKSNFNTLSFYKDFDASNFLQVQEKRKILIANRKQIIKENMFRKKEQNLTAIFSNLNSGASTFTISTLVLSEISKAVRIFFRENEKTILISALEEWTNYLRSNAEKIKGIKYEIISAIDENLSTLIDLIFLRFPNDISLYISYWWKLLQFLKSNRIMYKLMQTLKHDSIRKEDLNFNQIEQIFTFSNTIDFTKLFKSENSTEMKTLNVAEYLADKYYSNQHSRLQLKELNSTYCKQFRTLNTATNIFIFFVYKTTSVFYINYSIVADTFENEAVQIHELYFPDEVISGSQGEIGNFNVLIKDNIIYAYYTLSSSDTKLFFSLYYLDTCSVILSKELKIEQDIAQVFHDNSFVFITWKNNKMHRVSLDPSLSLNESIEFNYSNTPYTMLNTWAINHIFYVTDPENNILEAFFTKNESTSKYELSVSKTGHINDPEFYISYNPRTNTAFTTTIKGESWYISWNEFDDNDKLKVSYTPYREMFYLDHKNIARDNAYENIILWYARYISLYGNFEYTYSEWGWVLTRLPQMFTFNILQNQFHFVITLLHGGNEGKCQLWTAYLIIIKQFLNTLHHIDQYAMISTESWGLLSSTIQRMIMNYHTLEPEERYDVINEICEIVEYLKQNNPQYTLEGLDIEDIARKENWSFVDRLSLIKLISIFDSGISSDINVFNHWELAIGIETEMIINTISSTGADYYYRHYSRINSILDFFFNNIYETNKLENEVQYFDILYPYVAQILTAITTNNKEQSPETSLLICNSFIFKLFYLLIQGFSETKTLKTLKEKLPELWNILISLDELNLQNPKIYDVNNIYEIETTHPFKHEKKRAIKVSLPSPSSIYLKYSPLSTMLKSLSISVQDPDTETTSIPLSLTTSFNSVIFNVKNFSIWIDPKQDKDTDDNEEQAKYGAKMQIIPILHNINEHIKWYRNNFVSLIQTISHSWITFILSTAQQKRNWETIHSNSDDIKNNKTDYEKLYTSKLLQFISIKPDLKNEAVEEGITPLEIIKNWSKLNEREEFVKLKNLYMREDTLIYPKTEAYKDIDFTLDENKKLIAVLNKILMKKNVILARWGGIIIMSFVTKIFAIIIKHKNYSGKVSQLSAAVNKVGVDKTVSEYLQLPNCEEIYNIWAECSKIKGMFNEWKNQTDEEKDFDEEMNKIIEDLNTKADFIYGIIIPSPLKSSSNECVELVDKWIELLKNSKFGIAEITTFSKYKNAKCEEKLFQLFLINTLWYTWTSETSINIILTSLNTHFRQHQKKIISFVDDLLGADYFLVDKVKHQFHILLDIIISKISSYDFNQWKATTKVNLYQSLIWKIKGRDFKILYKFLAIFTKIKESLHFEQDPKTVVIGYNIYTNDTVWDKLFEWFILFTTQVFNKIKPTWLTDDNSNSITRELSLQRSMSKIGEEDYVKIIDFIFCFYLIPENIKVTSKTMFTKYLLIIYKSLVNEWNLIHWVLSRSHVVITTWLKLISIPEFRYEIKWISLKLLGQIIYTCYKFENWDLLTNEWISFNRNDAESITSDITWYLINFFIKWGKAERSSLLKEKYANILCFIFINDEFNTLGKMDISITDMIFILKQGLDCTRIGNRWIFGSTAPENKTPFVSYNEKDWSCYLDSTIYNEKISSLNFYGRILGYSEDKNVFNWTDEDNNCFNVEEQISKINLLQSSGDKYIYYIDESSLTGKNNLKILSIPTKKAIINNGWIETNFKQLYVKYSEYIFDKINRFIRENPEDRLYSLFYFVKVFDILIPYLTPEQTKEMIKLWTPFWSMKKGKESFYWNSYENWTQSYRGWFDSDYEIITRCLDNVTWNRGGTDKKNELDTLFAYSLTKTRFTISHDHTLYTVETTTHNYCRDVHVSCLSNPINNIIKPNSFAVVDTWTNDLLDTITDNATEIKGILCSKIDLNGRDISTLSIPIVEHKEIPKEILEIFFNGSKEKHYSLYSNFISNLLPLPQDYTKSNSNPNTETDDFNYFESWFGEENSNFDGSNRNDIEAAVDEKLEFFTEMTNKIRFKSNRTYNHVIHWASRRILFSLWMADKISINDWLNIEAEVNQQNTLILNNFYLLHFEFYINKSVGNLLSFDVQSLIKTFMNYWTNNTEVTRHILKQFLTFFSLEINKITNMKKEFSAYLKWIIPYYTHNINESSYLYDIEFQNVYWIWENLLYFIKLGIPFGPELKDEYISLLKILFSSICSYPWCVKVKSFISEIYKSVITEVYDTWKLKKNNYEIYEEYMMKHSNINHLIKDLIKLNEIYFPSFEAKDAIPRNQTNWLEFVYIYLNIQFFLAYTRNAPGWIHEFLEDNSQMMWFYKTNLLLKVNNKYQGNDYNELLAQIAHFSGVIEVWTKDDDIVKHWNVKQFQGKLGTEEGYDIKGDSGSKRIKIKFKNVNEENVNTKFIVYTRNNEAWNIEAIINVSDWNSDCSYEIVVPGICKRLYCIPLKADNIPLYVFDCNCDRTSESSPIFWGLSSPKTKPIDIEKSSWDFGASYYNCLCWDEVKHKLYSFENTFCAALHSEDNGISNSEHTINTSGTPAESNTPVTNPNTTPASPFATPSTNKGTLLIRNNNIIYDIARNDPTWTAPVWTDKTKPSILEPPILLDKEKIKNIYLSEKNSFIITTTGSGYAIGDNSKFQIGSNLWSVVKTWTRINIPENNKFISCAIGELYYLFIIENNKKKHNLYSVGNKDLCQFGWDVALSSTYTSVIRKMKDVEDIEFKMVKACDKSSVALAKNGALFIFGYRKTPKVPGGNDGENVFTAMQVKWPINNEYIVEDIEISKIHTLWLVRERDDTGVFRRNVYIGKDVMSSAIGGTKDNKSNFNKIEFFEQNRIEWYPIKFGISWNKCFVWCQGVKPLLSAIQAGSKDSGNIEYEISIQETKTPSAISISFYNSPQLNQFIAIFKSWTKNITQEFLEWSEDYNLQLSEKAKEGKQNPSGGTCEDIIEFLNSWSSTKRYITKVITPDSSQVTNDIIYTYLSKKIRIINTQLPCFIERNTKCIDKTFLQLAILENLDFLSAENRWKKFNDGWAKIHRYNQSFGGIYINRFNALSFKDKNEPDTEFEKTIFSQVYKEWHTLESPKFFMNRNTRLFLAYLVDERATDQGGPYHEVISGICEELQSPSLDLFIKTPNNKNDVGNWRDKYIINPNIQWTEKYCSVWQFLGKLMASSISTKELLNLNLHPIIWDYLLGHGIHFYHFETIDCLFYKLIQDWDELSSNKATIANEEDFNNSFDLNFTIQNWNGKEIELIPDGCNKKVTLGNLKQFISLAKAAKINEIAKPTEEIKKGWNEVIDKSYLQILTWKQLEVLICGEYKLDIEFLKLKTLYEGYVESSQQVVWFWKWWSELSPEHQALYWRFVWGRTRWSSDNWSTINHYISKIYCSNADTTYPHASTCFFKLKIPEYTSQEIFETMMNYAIWNCNEIDAD